MADRTSWLYFPGNSGGSHRVTPADQSVLRLGASTDFTVGAWCMLYKKTGGTEGNDNHTLLYSEFNYATDLGYLFQVHASSGAVGIFSGNAWVGSASNTFAYGLKQHVVFRLAGSVLDIFINGAKVFTYPTIVRKAGAGNSCFFGEESSSFRTTFGQHHHIFSSRTALTDEQITSIVVDGVYPATDILYRLDEGGGLSASDASGNSNVGTIAGALFMYETELSAARQLRAPVREFERSLSITGAQYVDFPNRTTNVFLASGQYTWMGWINFSGTLGTNNIGRFVVKTHGSGSGIRITLDRTRWYCQNLNTFSAWSVLNPFLGLTNTWVHWAVTYDAANKAVDFYLNGVPFNAGQSVGSNFWTETQSDTTGPVRVGSDWANEGMKFLLADFVMLNEVLSASDIAAAYARGGVAGAQVAIYARLNEGSGLTAFDSSGNNNNGTLNGGASYSVNVPTKTRLTPRKPGKALSFNGTSDYAVMPVTPDTNGFSIGFWLKLRNYALNQRIIDWGDGGPTGGFHFLPISVGAIQFAIYNAAASDVRITGNFSPGEYVHVVGTYAPNNSALYVNGDLVGVDTNGIMTIASPALTIGRRSQSSANFQDMLLDELVYQNTATPWSQAQVRELYSRGIAPAGAIQWNFNDSATDENGQNAITLNGTAYSSEVPVPQRAAVSTRLVATKPNRVNPVGSSCHLDGLGASDLDRQLALMSQAGIKWIRYDFTLDRIQATEGVYDYSVYDNVTTKAQALGIETIALLPQYGVPAWAISGPGSNVTTPAIYQDFCQQVAAHYGSAIKLYEMGNEPNGVTFWQPAPDTAAYTALMIAGYNGIKAGNPSAKVISGGLSAGGWGGGQNADAFLTTMYANGAQGYFDYFGIHPYSWPNDPETGFRMIDTCRAIMAANGDGGKAQMITELGWPTHTRGTTTIYGNTEAVSAHFIGRVFDKLMFEGYTDVPLACIYDFYDDGADRTYSEHNFGMLRRDYSLKPGYYALQETARLFRQRFTPVNPY